MQTHSELLSSTHDMASEVQICCLYNILKTCRALFARNKSTPNWREIPQPYASIWSYATASRCVIASTWCAVLSQLEPLHLTTLAGCCWQGRNIDGRGDGPHVQGSGAGQGGDVDNDGKHLLMGKDVRSQTQTISEDHCCFHQTWYQSSGGTKDAGAACLSREEQKWRCLIICIYLVMDHALKLKYHERPPLDVEGGHCHTFSTEVKDSGVAHWLSFTIPQNCQ